MLNQQRFPTKNSMKGPKNGDGTLLERVLQKMRGCVKELETCLEVEYEKSSKIKNEDIGASISQFAIGHMLPDSRNRGLGDVIAANVLDSINANLLCIHTQSAHAYYPRAAIQYLIKSHPKAYRHFPHLIVVTPTEEDVTLAVAALTKARKGRWFKIEKVSSELIEKTLSSEYKTRPFVDILVGTADELARYIKKMDDVELLEKLQDVVTQLFLVNSEAIAANERFAADFREVTAAFKHTAASFVVLFDFHEAKCSILEFRKMLLPLIAKSVFIEVEKTKSNKFFESVDILSVMSADELSNFLSAYRAVGTDISESSISYTKTTKTPVVQKLDSLVEIIKEVRKQRSNKNSDRSLSRAERILIITKDSQTAAFVMMYLMSEQLHREKRDRYSVRKITEEDSLEQIEQRNHEFRCANLDVLVINWRSIRFVNRGTIDSVIFFNAPELDYFQTVMEEELQNLVSVRSNFLPKIFILFEQPTDEFLLHEFAKFFHKYNAPVPQWFLSAYDSFYDRLNSTITEF